MDDNHPLDDGVNTESNKPQKENPVPLPLESTSELPPEIDGVRVSALQSISPNIMDILEEEDEESSYALHPKLIRKKQNNGQDRKVYSIANETKEAEYQVKSRTILFSLDNYKNSALVKNLLYFIVFIAIGWGLKTLWEAGPSDTEIYNTLQEKLQEVQTLRDKGAQQSDWEQLTTRSQSEMQPLIKYLEKNASQEE